MSLIVLAKVGLVTCGVMALYFWALLRVGGARSTYGIKPPHCDGPEAFMRIFRAQQNTLEQIVLFLPMLWLCAIYFNPLYATVLGIIWLGARIWYVLAYSAETDKRKPPFIIAIIMTVLLFIGALYGVITALITP